MQVCTFASIIVSDHSWALDSVDDLQYAVMRDVLLASSPIAEHETLNHPVSCEYLCGTQSMARRNNFDGVVLVILAASSASADPIQDLRSLLDTASKSPVYSARPFMDDPNATVQRFWLLLHDISTNGSDLTT